MSMRFASAALACFAITALCPTPASGGAKPPPAAPAWTLAEMSIEELSEIEVFSPSRHLEPTRGVPNAIFVLTGEDIVRSGVTSLPDALRLVPGAHVGRVDGNKWAVSLRGFNARSANKLLVLVDGRSIYDPLFSGMLWESQDFVLEDIERIEVIRGPGGTLWGANAFNGVINIVTKSASATEGTLVSLTAGDEERYIAVLRHGWRMGEGNDVRVYAKARERDSGFSADLEPFDGLEDLRGGFRWDWSNRDGDELRLSGDLFRAEAGIRDTPDLAHTVSHRGRNLLARWLRELSTDSSFFLQLYYDYVDYQSIRFTEDRDTYDLEFQHNFEARARHLIVWGAGYRRIRDRAVTAFPGFVDVLPRIREDAIESLFFQDTVALIPEKLHLVLGIKYEETDYAEASWLPNVRLAWMPDEEQTWWAAVSEATRVPSRLESDLTFGNTIRIGENFGAEEVRAFEAGHRRLVSSSIWYDIVLFYNDYESLRTTEADGTLANGIHGSTRGAELALRFQPGADLRFDAAYSYFDIDLSLDPGSTASPALPVLYEGLSPRHQLSLRGMYWLREGMELDGTLRYVDDLPALEVPDYVQLDLALHWRPLAGWQFSLMVANLLDSHQPEQGFPFSSTGVATEAERSIYARATWRR